VIVRALAHCAKHAGGAILKMARCAEAHPMANKKAAFAAFLFAAGDSADQR
jgi:hypothetical protein